LPGPDKGGSQQTRGIAIQRNRLRAVLDALPVGVALVDSRGGILESNAAFEQIWGAPRATTGSVEDYAAYKAWWADTSRPVQAEEWAAARAVRNGETVVNQELQIERFDGSRAFVLNSAAPIRDAQGRISGAAVAIRDITELRAAEEALRESEGRFRSLFRNATVGIYRTTPAGRIEFANPALIKMLGYDSFADLARRNLEECGFEPEYPRSSFRQKLEREGAIQGLEATWVRKDGTGLRVRESARCIRDAAGTIRWYEGIVEDISERKRTENALRDSEQKFATTFRLGPAAMTIVDVENGFRIIDANNQFEQATGYSRNELVGRSALELGILPPGEHARAQELFHAEGRVHNLEVQLGTKSGEIRTALLSSEAVEIDGQRCAITCILDITERNRAEEERERLQQQLAHAQKLESVGRLAGGIAHDFNNLMSAILMYAESALKELERGKSAAGSVTAIRDAAEKAIAVGRQLMVFSSKKVLQTEVLDLNAVIGENLKLMQRLIREDIKVSFQPGSRGSLVKADRGQLGQVIMNLAVNSRDAMPQGGTFTIETADVEVEEADVERNPDAKPGPYVMLTVTDTGVGMDKETRSRAFEPFFTTKAVGKGTGLGLPVVYGIVKESGGFITVASEPGEGTEFRIYLPAAQGPATPIPESEEEPVHGGSETILLAEDEFAVREKVRDLLENAGYRVLPASDGGQAFRLASEESQPIHLLLTDVVMPELSGPRLFERLRPHRPEMKVLYMSGYPDADDARIDVRSEPNFMPKPFTEAQLLRRVRKALDETG
jgi:PAS domain S-box-containing protein